MFLYEWTDTTCVEQLAERARENQLWLEPPSVYVIVSEAKILYSSMGDPFPAEMKPNLAMLWQRSPRNLPRIGPAPLKGQCKSAKFWFPPTKRRRWRENMGSTPLRAFSLSIR